MSKRRYKAKEVADAILDASGVVTDAARALGCSRETVYQYRDEYKAVQEAFDVARRGIVDEAKGYLTGMMRTPDHKDHYKAVMKILTTYDSEVDWSDRKQITGADRGPIEVKGIDFSPHE